MSESNRSFWSSVPGFVTGLAGLLTAVVGLVTVLIQLDVIGGDSNGGDSATTTTSVAGAQAGAAGGATGGGTTTTGPPQFTVSPATLDFPAGTREKTVQVRNTGSSTLTLAAPTVDGKDAAQFRADGCSTPVRAGLSCDLRVTFTASGPLRTYEARLQLTAPGARGQEVRLTASTIL